MRYPHIIEQRIQAILPATALTSDDAVIEPNRLLVEALVQQLRVLLQAVERFDREIAELAPTLSDYTLFTSFPGAGPVFAPRLLAAFGEQRERYASADEVQKYSGIAPVTERSGNKCWVHWRLQCPKFLRQTFVELAALSIPHCYWAKAYYDQQRERGVLTPGGAACARLQVDPHRLSLLAEPHTLRRSHLPQRPQASWLAAAELRS